MLYSLLHHQHLWHLKLHNLQLQLSYILLMEEVVLTSTVEVATTFLVEVTIIITTTIPALLCH